MSKMSMRKPGLHIGAHVFTPSGWGYILTPPIGDLYAVHLDTEEVVNYFSSDIRPENFWEFLTKRPGNVGRWSKGQFAVVQIMLHLALAAGILTFLDGGWVAVVAYVGIQALIFYGMRRNWKGLQA